MAQKIRIKNIVVNNVSIKNNMIPAGQFEMRPSFKLTIEKNETNSEYLMELSVSISSENDKPFPMDLSACVTGYFEIESDDQESIDGLLKNQCFYILFPYLKALVASITASSLFPAIQLPLIPPNDFVQESDN